MSDITRRNLLKGAAVAPAAVSEDARLNLIEIVVDTWGAHWMGCYGAAQTRTPNADALAARSAVYEDAYPEALPTLPARRALYTGRRIFPSELILQRDDGVKIRGWHQLFTEDVTLSETLQGAGYTTAIVSDVYHQFKPDKNYHRGFDCWRWIRGQEADRLATGPRRAIDPSRYLHASQAAQLKNRNNVMTQYLLNRRDWKTEDDWLPAQVFREASRWVADNAAENQPFHLHVESFSPHELWDPPEEYYRLHMKSDYRGPRLIHPPIVTAKMSPLEVEHVRALYAGLVSFVDARLGKFLQTVESLGLMKNTLIVLTADHGTMMGEQNQLHKGEQRLRTQVTHVPLMIYHPRQNWAGRRVKGFVQHTDVMPTILELLAVKAPSRVTGRSLTGGASPESIFIGWGEHASIRTPEWCYIGHWSPGTPFEQLYDLKRDPLELNDVADRHPALVREFRGRLKNYVASGWDVTRGTFAATLAGS